MSLMHSTKHLLMFLFGIVIVLALVSFAYSLGIQGPFLLDDFSSLQGIGAYGGVQNSSDLLRYILGSTGLEWSRSFSYLSFLVDDQYWPSDASIFKKTNVAIHLIIGLITFLLLYTSIKLKLDNNKALVIASFASLIWLIHPLHVSTTLYVVQRMAQLSALFVLLSLLCYVCALKTKSNAQFFLAVFLAFFFGSLGFLSKENALCVVWLMTWLDMTLKPIGYRKSIYKSVVSKCLIFSSLLLMCLFTYSSISSDFNFRVFNQVERIQEQGAVLAKYWHYWLLPWGADTTIFHDDMEYRVLQGYALKDSSWWVLHSSIILVAFFVRKKHILITFGIGFFYISHIIESTLWPLELMYEHRNYLPSIGLALSMSCILYEVFEYLKYKKLVLVSYGVIFLFIGSLFIQLVYRSSLWSDYKVLILKWSYEHPYSLRAQSSLATLYAASGMVSLSANTLEAAYSKTPNLKLRLQQLNLQCTADIETSKLVSLSLEDVKNSYFSSGIIYELEASTYHVDCIERYLIGLDYEILLGEIETMKGLSSHERYMALFYDIVGAYYTKKKNYSSAVEARIKLYNTQPTIDTALKAAEVFLSGGDIKMSKKFLSIAKGYYDGLWYDDPLRESQIINLENGINFISSNK